MNESSPPDQEDLQRELEILRSIIRKNIARLGQDPLLGKQLDFWMESACFLTTEIRIWESVGNDTRYDLAVERMHKVLEILQELIEQLDDGSRDGES
ncbi:MAG TPA: hypothetical protein VJ785_03505 [Anaerolineales bacterium]|nr:hypothetical protein [Anaerolineales bacterium]